MHNDLLLAVDIGNTNIVFGLFSGQSLIREWRLHTDLNITEDELFVAVSSLCNYNDQRLADLKNVVICCVVPSLLYPFEAFCTAYLNTAPLVIGPDTPTKIKIRIDNPSELGADRLVNGVAGFEKYKTDLIIVDFGTATTFDYISAKGEYLGGVIAPGILISCEALFSKAAKLPRSAIFKPPETIIGKNTVAGMNAGVVYGFASMVDGIIARMRKETGNRLKVIATGGLASLIVPECKNVRTIEPHLTLEGLRSIHEQARRLSENS